ncbi:MAG: glycosyltransferase family 4 protein [Brevefilum sp.]|nr:glycosyltransferase family 4 protein [Brevefilum sp.]
MKVVAFSINPVFPDLITGGASKHLYHITRALGKAGHQVQLLCAQGGQDSAGFEWAENVHVSPTLPFHLPFPQPYAISGADLGLIVERVSAALDGADRFYIHDGEFLVPDVYKEIPTVTSFRDNIYPESVLGTFVGKPDEVICVSKYSTDVVKYSAGRYFPGLLDRLHHVNNGIDFEMFKPVETARLAKALGVDPQRDTILLHPHRPEPGKGLPETIQVVDQLVNRHGLRNVKVLIPEWIDSMVSSGESAFYQEMTQLMKDLGVSDRFVFTPWMPQSQMPALYSLGYATLSLGNFVEAFGNVAYESLACGTHSIVAKVGVHRTNMPDDLIGKVNYGDIDAAVEQLLAYLTGEGPNPADVLEYIKTQMDFQHQVTSYREIIINCKKREPLQFIPPQLSEHQPFALAPWCDIDGKRIFHDFRGTYEEDRVLTDMLRKSALVSQAEAAALGIPDQQWQQWLDKTWLVPVELA